MPHDMDSLGTLARKHDPTSTARRPQPDEVVLPLEVSAAVERARNKRLSYSVRLLVAPSGRPIVLVGEIHLKLRAASVLGKELIAQFPLRGVETFQVQSVVAGWLLRALIIAPRLMLRALSLGLIKGSSIVDAKRAPTGETVELEKGFRAPLSLQVGALYLTAFFSSMFACLILLVLLGIEPSMILRSGIVRPLLNITRLFELHTLVFLPLAVVLRNRSWSWILYPAITILTVRDEFLAKGTVRMLEVHAGSTPAMLIIGRAHVSGCARLLIEKYGFRSVDLL